MGKRELLLIVGFLVLGTLVYVATAPQRPEGGRGFSLARALEGIRREVRGHRASAELTTSAVHAVPPSVNELRVNIPAAQITIVGEPRTDIASDLYVWSNGYDEAEARSLAGQTRLELEPAGPSLTATIDFPEPGSQRARLTLRVPSRMALQMEPTSGRLEISGVASVEHESARGETIIRQVPGRVTATHRGGRLMISDVGPLRLNARGSDIQLTGVHGEATLQVQAGELRCAELAGPVDLEASGAEVTFEMLEKTRGPIRINAISGDLTVRGLGSEARIDGRGADMDITIERAAAIAIFNSDDRVQVTLPAGGYQLDGVTTGGRITIPDELKALLTVSEPDADQEQRVSGRVNGGGDTITIRTRRGDIRINPRSAPPVQR